MPTIVKIYPLSFIVLGKERDLGAGWCGESDRRGKKKNIFPKIKIWRLPLKSSLAESHSSFLLLKDVILVSAIPQIFIQ